MNNAGIKKIGMMIGHFEPLHLGHVRSVLHTAGQVEHLHILITPHPNPNSNYPVTLQDKARWLQMAFSDLPFVEIHILDEPLIPANRNKDFHQVMLDMDHTNSKLLHAMNIMGLNMIASKKSAESPVLFVAENHPLNQAQVYDSLVIDVQSTPNYPEFDSYEIQKNPVNYWSLIHPEAREDYTKTIAIVGGESSGKTTLVQKVANHYGADVVLEMGRLYVHSALGGSELGLQYRDYTSIVLDHAQAIRDAMYQAKAPVIVIDTDFATTQAFYEEYEGKSHPFVAACIDEIRLDHTVMLDNNVPWLADGIRSLGNEVARKRFKARLLEVFNRHDITPYKVTDDDYHQRYLAVIEYIDKKIYGKEAPK